MIAANAQKMDVTKDYRSNQEISPLARKKRRPDRSQGGLLSSKDKSIILKGIVLIGLIAIGLVVSSAYCAGVNYSNNLLREENIALRGEVDTLSIQLQSANNIAHIEKEAIENLGMVYAEGDFFVPVYTREKPEDNLAGLLKAKAYR